jgi:Ion channel
VCFYLFVGYGDITPSTASAKAVTVLVIISGFVIIPTQVAALVSAIVSRPRYLGWLKLPPNTQHICVCGVVDYELIYRLTTEVFHPTHAPAVIGANIVVAILSPTPPSEPVRILLRLTQFRSRVQFFIGSAKSFTDLSRVKAEDALAIYTVSDVTVRSLRAEEDSVFLSAISISRYLDCKQWSRLERAVRSQKGFNWRTKRIDSPFRRPPQGSLDSEAADTADMEIDPRLCERPRTMVKLTSSARNRPVLSQSGIDVVLPLQEFKYTLIAYGSMFPGFLSLFLNLNRSRAPSQQTRQQWRQPELFYGRYIHASSAPLSIPCKDHTLNNNDHLLSFLILTLSQRALGIVYIS